jgi:xanthine dehydrogenase YagR molybdenum-binding subunit
LRLSELTNEVGDITILGRGSREPNRLDVNVRTFGAQFADVEVDINTGEVKVLKMATVHDFGRVINPLGSRSQAEGAIIQGIGFALTEAG